MFLINNSTIDILKTKFTKIEKLLNIINKKDVQHIFIDAIIITDEKDLTLTFKENQAVKNNQQRKYLFSLTSSSLKDEKEYFQLH